jgi:endonuclease YncB( thermonuclease family)
MDIDWSSVNNDTPLFSLEGNFVQCKVVNVYDGDTCKVVFPLNGEIYRWNVRLTGYDTPEMRPPRSQENRDEEIKAAYLARDFLKSKVMNEEQLVYIKCGEFDKYGRLLGTLFLEENDEVSVNDLMIENGHGYAYDGGTKKKFA